MRGKIAVWCVILAFLSVLAYTVCVNAQDQQPPRDQRPELQPPQDRMPPSVSPDFMRAMRSMNTPVAMQVEGKHVYVVKADLLMKFDAETLQLVAKSKLPMEEDERAPQPPGQ